MGIDAVASDRRFKAAVFEVGLPGMSVHLRTAPIPSPQTSASGWDRSSTPP